MKNLLKNSYNEIKVGKSTIKAEDFPTNPR